MNKVYIVLVNYNKFRDTIECLESLLKSDYLNFQIFVVDNSSDDSSINGLSNWLTNDSYNDIATDFESLIYPLEPKPINHCIVPASEFVECEKLLEYKITIIRAINEGFAAANNIVLRHILKNGADDSLVWLLNNDTVVNNDTLYHLVHFYQERISNKFILGSKLRYYHAPHIIQAVAGDYNKWLGKHYHIGSGEEDNGQYDSYAPGKMGYMVGASMFFPKLFLDQVGLISEEYFLYFEELDWMQRGLRHGYKTAVVPNSIVYHKEGASITNAGNNNSQMDIADYYSITNRVRFIKKWYPYCLVTVMVGVIWALVKRLIKGKFKLVKRTSIGVLRILFKK